MHEQRIARVEPQRCENRPVPAADGSASAQTDDEVIAKSGAPAPSPSSTSTDPAEASAAPRPTFRKRFWEFLREPAWWFRDIVVALVVSGLLSLVIYRVQDGSDDRRADDALKSDDRIARLQTRLANLQFVRARSGTDIEPRPFDSLDLAGQQLGGLQLEGAEFRYANLRDSDFRDSDLRGADFGYADLAKAVFLHTDLTGAQLDRQGVSSVDDSQPVGTFVAANLSHAKVLGLKIVSSGPLNLTGAMLFGSDLSALSPSDLHGLSGVCYDRSTVWPSNFTPPRSASIASCTSGWLKIFYPSRGQAIPWSDYGLTPG